MLWKTYLHSRTDCPREDLVGLEFGQSVSTLSFGSHAVTNQYLTCTTTPIPMLSGKDTILIHELINDHPMTIIPPCLPALPIDVSTTLVFRLFHPTNLRREKKVADNLHRPRKQPVSTLAHSLHLVYVGKV